MARPAGETSSALFEVLEDWNEYLKHMLLLTRSRRYDCGGQFSGDIRSIPKRQSSFKKQPVSEHTSSFLPSLNY
jgi:hypothetical protein